MEFTLQVHFSAGSGSSNRSKDWPDLPFPATPNAMGKAWHSFNAAALAELLPPGLTKQRGKIVFVDVTPDASRLHIAYFVEVDEIDRADNVLANAGFYH